MKRREFLVFLALALVAPGLSAESSPIIEVWRTASCGCCGAWVKHLQTNGFATKVHIVRDTSAMRRTLGIPSRLGACHTAKVDGYAIEGHVPANDIRRLLAERPKALGLAVPGMPAGSPGMDRPNSPPFEVLLMDSDAKTSVFSRHTPHR